jgi:hypothetical protein
MPEQEAVELLRKAPEVSHMCLDDPAMRAKLQYCREVLGLSLRDTLLHHRGFLKEGLRRVEQRVRRAMSVRALREQGAAASCWGAITVLNKHCLQLALPVHVCTLLPRSAAV